MHWFDHLLSVWRVFAFGPPAAEQGWKRGKSPYKQQNQHGCHSPFVSGRMATEQEEPRRKYYYCHSRDKAAHDEFHLGLPLHLILLIQSNSVYMVLSHIHTSIINALNMLRIPPNPYRSKVSSFALLDNITMCDRVVGSCSYL
jgi:hypothetical protein